MDNPDLRSRFDDIVAAARRDTLLSATGSVFLGIVVVPALGLLLYVVTLYLFGELPVGLPAFVVVFSVGILAVGFWQSRTQPSVRLPPVGDRSEDSDLDPWDSWGGWVDSGHTGGQPGGARVFVWWVVVRGILTGFPRFSYDLLRLFPYYPLETLFLFRFHNFHPRK